MGYRKTTRRLKVSLEDHKVYGNVDPGEDCPVAYARGKTLDEYLHLMSLTDTGDNTEGNSELIRQLEEFGASLIEWNLEDEDGKPIPCTRDGLFSIDNDLAFALASEWMAKLGGKTDAPLPQSSPSGEPSLVESVPTEALSAPPPPTAVPA